MNRPFIVFVLGLLGLIIVGFGIFFFLWLRAQPADTSSGQGVLGGFFGGRTVTPERIPIPREEEGSAVPDTRQTLFLIHDKPVAGFVSFERGAEPFVRFAERETGHVYEFSFETGEKVRLSGTTVPAVTEALFSGNGEIALFRYLEDDSSVRNAVGILPATSTDSFKKVHFLENDAYAISFSPNSKELFYLRKEANGSQGFVMGSEGGNRRSVFSSPLTEWSSVWVSDTVLYLVQKPGPGAGIVYRLNPKTRELKNFGIGEGIAAIIPTAPLTLASPLQGEEVGPLQRFSEVSGFSGQEVLQTIPDKCAVEKKSLYCASPTSASIPLVGRVLNWYRGEFTTIDQLSYTNASGTPSTFGEFSQEFDIDEIDVVTQETFLAFRNKKDGALWGYRLR
ncbi:MAG TPA: hypothetical protein VJG29_01530 [Candidatus Paceibacterota bacterium]